MTSPAIEIVRVGRVDSTQRIARERARAGAAAGTVIVADEQTEGRGRDGRSWFSPPGGGVWLTWIHRTARPAVEWPAITSVAALAAALALRRFGVEPRVRWPNDLVATGGKIAGILADAEPDAVLIGLGINGTQRPDSFPEELRGIATSAAAECERVGRAAPELASILAAAIEEMGTMLERFEHGGPAEILPAVWEASAVRGRRVRIARPGGSEVEGVAAGLGPAGELILDRGDGTAQMIASGRMIAMEDA